MTTLTSAELLGESLEVLPSKETLSVTTWADVTAINGALALNAGSRMAEAAAEASQLVIVSQG
jgi:hypothetical protein